MKIVGLSFGGHDSSYAIFENGVLLVHEELERHSRTKEDDGDIIQFYIDRHGSFDDVDIVAHTNNGEKTEFGRRKQSWHIIEKLRDEGKLEVVQVGHQRSHAANAFFSSNFLNAMIFTIDGGGWDEEPNGPGGPFPSSWSVWVGEDTKIYPKQFRYDFNVGVMWNTVTEQVYNMSGGGPPYGCQAGTVMAMAAMGNPDIYFDDFLSSGPLGVGWRSMDFPKYANLDEQGKFDFAASLQKYTEHCLRNEMSKWIQPETEYICLSGGVALNSVMTGKIQSWFPQIKDVYIPPVPYDGGLAIGNAQHVLHQIQDLPRTKWEDNAPPYLGLPYSKEEVFNALEEADGISYEKATINDVCKLLHDEKIVSVFSGGSESGRRALGNRSILADPTNPRIKDIVNEKVKHRQWFRPFAPSILREEVSNWFTSDKSSPYMGFVLKFKEDMRDKVPGVVHFDGSARLQTVTEKDNKWYYNFLKEWNAVSGVPIILNTSFNDREPIVERPEHAINCFKGTNIDYLYFVDNEILVRKV